MNVNTILQDLKAERERVQKAIQALEAIGGATPKAGRRGRQKAVAKALRKRARRRMSAAVRAKLARLMKQRWAARKKAGKTKLGA